MHLQTVELATGKNPQHCVVWLHGLGADGHDFEPIVPELRLDQAVRFVFPHAPIRSVTINGGMEMRAWYDVTPSDPASATTGICDSAELVQEVIKRELESGFAPSNIVLAGFSQGGVVALHMGLRADPCFAGVVALSTYLHDHANAINHVSLASVDTPIFMAHGTMDPMIPIASAVTSRDVLTTSNYAVEWHQYEMAHQVCYEELVDISKFLGRVFEPSV